MNRNFDIFLMFEFVIVSSEMVIHCISQIFWSFHFVLVKAFAIFAV